MKLTHFQPSVNIDVGTRVRWLGPELSRPDGSALRVGKSGRVLRVIPPRHGPGTWLAPDIVDRGHAGYAVVRFPEWGEHCIYATGEGERWERA